MFRKMRRFKQELPYEDTLKVIERGSHGVLAVLSDDGYPYAVPLSYVYADGKLYFHCAAQGQKLDAILNSPKASFCVVGQDNVVPEKVTSIYESAISFGRVRIVEDETEKRKALLFLAGKYFSANGDAKNEEEIADSWSRVRVLALDIEHMTGKASMDIINSKN
ncbi:MAG: pyridoxamine 5'-phosphate oxidase family protein [Oscillospiraceae bacterium]